MLNCEIRDFDTLLSLSFISLSLWLISVTHYPSLCLPRLSKSALLIVESGIERWTKSFNILLSLWLHLPLYGSTLWLITLLTLWLISTSLCGSSPFSHCLCRSALLIVESGVDCWVRERTNSFIELVHFDFFILNSMRSNVYIMDGTPVPHVCDALASRRERWWSVNLRTLMVVVLHSFTVVILHSSAVNHDKIWASRTLSSVRSPPAPDDRPVRTLATLCAKDDVSLLWHLFLGGRFKEEVEFRLMEGMWWCSMIMMWWCSIGWSVMARLPNFC